MRVVLLAVLWLIQGGSTALSAQGISTTAIRGTVRAESGAGVEGAHVRIVNLPTGYANETRVRGGRFLVQGLPTGGPYRIVVRGLGYSAQMMDSVWLTLGEEREVEFTLVAVARELDTVRVSATNYRHRLQSAGGVGTSISDSQLRRLPTLNRDIYDFVRLVPQAGSRFGLTGAGSSFRFNSFVIDGVSDRQLQGNNVVGGAVGGKTISVEAVKEYQVLLSPYDARYGDFTGLLVNAVTKSGTNDVRGTIFGYMRNEQLARTNSFIGSSPYRNEQFGFSLGGPIVRDRVHFFIAPEFQHSVAPAPGPYVGQRVDALPPLPVSPSDVERFASLLRAKGLDPGDGGRLTLLNPAMTLFGRLDIAIPEWKSRVVVRDNYSTFDAMRFARSENGPGFPLTSWASTLRTSKHAPGIQIFTQPSSAVFNEFMLAYLDRPQSFLIRTRSPFIQAGVPGPNGVQFALGAGPPATYGGNDATQRLLEIADHFELQTGSRHTVGAGVHFEVFRFHVVGARGILGQWAFSSLDALEKGDANFYQIGKDFGTGSAPVNGAQTSGYVTDAWRITERLSLMLGLRADALRFSSRPLYNPAVDSVLHRRTSDYPRPRVQWSPRFGFDWQPFDDHLTRVRGGAGIFVARPPLGWLLGPARLNGTGVRTLTCSERLGAKVPKFVADPALQPQECPDGRGFSDGPVDLVDRNLRMAESFRASVGIDRRLPWNLDASIDALYTRVRSDFIFVNVNLSGPRGVDSHGRIMYGTIGPTGAATTALVTDRFPEAIDLRNHSLGYSWAVTAQINRSFFDRLGLQAAYTRSRSRDLQSLTNTSALAPLDIWASGRPLAVRHDDLTTGVSAFEIPDRVVLAATYAAPWKRWTTDFSIYYIGESGTPFTYGDSSAFGLGDLNADGTNANDPIYVPRDATDPSEILLGNAMQAEALETFIRDTPCLRRQRGAIVARNSCRGPWVTTSNALVRQSLHAIGRNNLSLQLEVFNVLNLLNSSWGLFRVPNRILLRHTGQTVPTYGVSPQPIFSFDPATAGTSTRNVESGYQLQLSLRYGF
jgi:hypothetical protein